MDLQDPFRGTQLTPDQNEFNISMIYQLSGYVGMLLKILNFLTKKALK